MGDGVHDVRIAFGDHLLRDAHCPRNRDPPHVVSPEINQHHVFGALLGIGLQLGLQGGVGLGRRAARLSSGDGAQLDLVSIQADQHFRRRAGHDRLRKIQVKHVRRWVGDPERTVDIERINVAARDLEPLRVHHLERVARQDVVLNSAHIGLERLARHRRLGRGGLDRRGVQRAQRRCRTCQSVQNVVDAAAGAVVRLGRIHPATHVGGGHHLHGSPQVVEDDHRIGHAETDLREAQDIRLRGGQILEGPHGVVADPAHGAPEKTWQSRRDRGRQVGQIAIDETHGIAVLEPFDDLERAGGFARLTGAAARARAQNFDLGPAGANHGPRTDSDEAVSRPFLAAHDALEQKGIRPSPELCVGGDGRIRIGNHLAIDEGQAPSAGKFDETSVVWNVV